MRVPNAERRRRSFRVRGWLIAVGILLVILLFSLRGLAGFYTDYLWFDSVGQGDTWRRLLAARIVPALVFTIVFFVIMLANLLIADRLAPTYRLDRAPRTSSSSATSSRPARTRAGSGSASRCSSR